MNDNPRFNALVRSVYILRDIFDPLIDRVGDSGPGREARKARKVEGAEWE